jgi:hypothetical protein
MLASSIRRITLTLVLASLPSVLTAAGSTAADKTQQPIGADQAASLDCGSAYYAPGSYSSWFYVSPPACDQTSPVPEPAMPIPGPTALNLPAYYDYEPRWGPLVG